jgi:hypothetical protein
MNILNTVVAQGITGDYHLQRSNVVWRSGGTCKKWHSDFSYFCNLLTSRSTLCMHLSAIGQPKATMDLPERAGQEENQKDWTSRELNPGPPVNQMSNSC